MTPNAFWCLIDDATQDEDPFLFSLLQFPCQSLSSSFSHFLFILSSLYSAAYFSLSLLHLSLSVYFVRPCKLLPHTIHHPLSTIHEVIFSLLSFHSVLYPFFTFLLTSIHANTAKGRESLQCLCVSLLKHQPSDSSVGDGKWTTNESTFQEEVNLTAWLIVLVLCCCCRRCCSRCCCCCSCCCHSCCCVDGTTAALVVPLEHQPVWLNDCKRVYFGGSFLSPPCFVCLKVSLQLFVSSDNRRVYRDLCHGCFVLY